MAETVPPPETMRTVVAEYVRSVHSTYLDHVAHLPPGERAALPLVGRHLTVLAAANQRLHLVATTRGWPESTAASVADEYADLAWQVAFLDPSILPSLGLVDDEDPAAVRRVLGVEDVVYHLCVMVGGSLTTHHAQHSAVALANQHTSLSRDAECLRHALPRSPEVEELVSCARLGLDHAAALLAADLTSGRVSGPREASDSLRQVVQDVSP